MKNSLNLNKILFISTSELLHSKRNRGTFFTLKNIYNSITKKASILIITLITLSAISCNKENDLQIEQENTPTSEDNKIVISSVNQQLIFDVRQANNEAIKKHDALGVAAHYTDNFFILTSTNGLFTGKEKVGEIYQSVFNSRKEVIFIRASTKITVNEDWNMASENGSWIGQWEQENKMIEVAGDYYAKWHKIDGEWKLRSEVYTQFDCTGEVVCNNKPTL